MKSLLYGLVLLTITSVAFADVWTTFRNCHTPDASYSRQEIAPEGGCSPGELPEHNESGRPETICVSNVQRDLPSMEIAVYGSPAGFRAYVYEGGIYQRTIITFPGFGCMMANPGTNLIDVGEYVYDRTRLVSTFMELNCSGDELQNFKIKR